MLLLVSLCYVNKATIPWGVGGRPAADPPFSSERLKVETASVGECSVLIWVRSTNAHHNYPTCNSQFKDTGGDVHFKALASVQEHVGVAFRRTHKHHTCLEPAAFPWISTNVFFNKTGETNPKPAPQETTAGPNRVNVDPNSHERDRKGAGQQQVREVFPVTGVNQVCMSWVSSL